LTRQARNFFIRDSRLEVELRIRAGGNLTYRNLLSDASTTFSTRLVKRSALAQALPAQTVQVTPEQRLAQLHARFDGIRRRYGL